MSERERHDFIEALTTQRGFLMATVRALDDDAARSTPTASSLSLASIIKHVSDTEAEWINFARTGVMPGGGGADDSGEWDGVDTRFDLIEADTIEAILARYAEVAATTEAYIREADLDRAHPLPPAPWFEAGVAWSGRRVLTHLLAETAQHCGHADIIRETIDGAKTMG